MIQPSRILVAGGSCLPEELKPFAKELGQGLMTQSNFTLVTGGLESREADTVAADFVVANAANTELEKRNEPSRSRIITMLPESDVKSFKRFRFGSVLDIEYSNPNSRRFSMALMSDAVLTIHGGKGTGEIIDLAYASGKVLIPIPATGGKSLDRWRRYKKEIIKRLRATEDEIACLEDKSDLKAVVGTCISLLRRVLRPQCFVAMAFNLHPIPNAYETICSVLETKGYQPIRVDKLSFSGNIVDAIWAAIRASEIAIVDLTNQRPNVYYELGICHANSKPTILTMLLIDDKELNDIPFDIKVHRIVTYDTQESLYNQLMKNVPGSKVITTMEASKR